MFFWQRVHILHVIASRIQGRKMDIDNQRLAMAVHGAIGILKPDGSVAFCVNIQSLGAGYIEEGRYVWPPKLI